MPMAPRSGTRPAARCLNAPVRTRTRRCRPAPRRGPETCQAGPAAQRRIEIADALAIVTQPPGEHMVVPGTRVDADCDRAAAGSGVSHDVGQGLLRDAIHPQRQVLRDGMLVEVLR